jgi:membrane protease YdiL (CAAX protease family)
MEVGEAENHWLAIKNARLEPQPFWGYEIKSLGWVTPQMIDVVTALIPSFAAGIALYVRLRNQITPPIPLGELLVLGLVLGPLLEESLFRGCILLVLARTAGRHPP